MRLVLLLAILLTAAAAGAAQHHDARYLIGGDPPSTSPAALPGLFLLDNSGATPTLQRLLLPGFTARFRMDADNRRVLVCVEGALASVGTLMPRGGIFRLDPATGAWSTIRHWGPTLNSFVSTYEGEFDHNGDLIATIYRFDRVVKPNNGIQLLKFHPSGSTSVLIPAGFTHYVTGKPTIDIATGHLLVASTHPPFPILSIDTRTHTVSTWHTGGALGFYGHYHLPQNHRTGAIEGPQGKVVHRVTRGTASVTTLGRLPVSVSGAGRYDLQTAASPRMIFAGRDGRGGTALYRLDAKTWTVTSVTLSSRSAVNHGFEFYRGRHTQSVLVAPRRWQVHLSAPRFAKFRYAVAAGVSGVRPGVRLPDGRHLNLNVDPITDLTLHGRLPGLWSGGPGVLDASGGAIAQLNLAGTQPYGIPLWVVWAVLDPQAPSGIAYLPDTYVLRI